MLQLGQLVQAMQLTLFYQCFSPPCSSIIILVTILYKGFYFLLLIFIKKRKNIMQFIPYTKYEKTCCVQVN